MSAFELVCTDGVQATFKLNGTKYGAMDDFTHFDPNHLDYQSPEFSILCFTDQSWDEMFQGNPGKKKELIQTGDWSYNGYGEICSVAPVTVDFGDFTFDIGGFTTDLRCIGEFVYIVIDRLDLSFPSRPN